jgi:hypothetical protein
VTRDDSEIIAPPHDAAWLFCRHGKQQLGS